MIDSSLFGADIPAGTYTAGDTIPLGIVDGPAVVRSGRGNALLKRITVGQVLNVSGSVTTWAITVKNSDWVDPIKSLTTSIIDPTMLDERSGCIQRGHDCPLTPNSSWEIVAECVIGGTTTIGNSIFALIDIDYPSVSSIVDPDTLPGIPASITLDNTGIHFKAGGTLTSGSVDIQNVDFFKAGYEYALEKLENLGSTGYSGFVSISDAAGMLGLKRIIPVCSGIPNIRNKIEYASKLVKGPLTIGYNFFAVSGTATTGTTKTIFDFVKRRM